MRIAKTISYQVLITAALLLLVEGLARIAYTVHLGWAKEAEWYVYAADVGWGRRPNFSGVDDCNEHRTFDEQGLVSSEAARLKKKREGQFRALFLGDSATYGYCVSTEATFVETMNRLHPEAAAVNLGVSGYTSYQGYKSLLKYGPLIDPDIIFISFSFNDRRLVLQPELADSDAAFQRLYSASRVQRLSDVSYLFGAAKLVSGWLRPADPGAAGFMSEVRLDRVRPRVDGQAYRENLTKMVQWAKQRGIAVAFIVLGDNPEQTRSLREGIRYLSEKNHELAIKYLTLAKDDDGGHWFSALARLYLAKAYEEAGLDGKAQQVLSLKKVMAGVHGGYPIVLDTEYAAIVKEVADEHSLQVIDAVGELNKNADVYFDFTHFDETGHEIVTGLVANAIEAAIKRGRLRARIGPAG
jgi:lysophospholipase L1-like esterase